MTVLGRLMKEQVPELTKGSSVDMDWEEADLRRAEVTVTRKQRGVYKPATKRSKG